MGDETNRRDLIRALNVALPLQHRCALAFAIAAGTLPGPEGVALSGRLRRWAADELLDVERVAARIATVGGRPATDIAGLKAPKTWKATVQWLADCQRQAIDAFVDAIPADADDAEGEATEHLLEHVISRKRDVLETLERALR